MFYFGDKVYKRKLLEVQGSGEFKGLFEDFFNFIGGEKV